MIRQIRGKVLSVGPLSAVILVAGFGIEVRMSAPETLSIGHEAHLATHLALKQDGLELYGFPDAEDRDFFELILSVPGVGAEDGSLGPAPFPARGARGGHRHARSRLSHQGRRAR